MTPRRTRWDHSTLVYLLAALIPGIALGLTLAHNIH